MRRPTPEFNKTRLEKQIYEEYERHGANFTTKLSQLFGARATSLSTIIK